MKNYKKYLLLISCAFFCFALTACGGKMQETDKPEATEEIVSADRKNEDLTDAEYTLSYIISCEAGGKSYELGSKNVFSITGRHTDEMKAYRVNSFTGQDYSDTENFYYSDGKALLIRYGERFLSGMDGEDFITYTESSELSLDTGFFETERFDECYVSERKGEKTYVFRTGNEELKQMIADFLGFSELDYIYTVNDLDMTVILSGNGTVKSKHITFDLSYYDEEYPDDIVTYSGDFSYTLDKTSDISVKTVSLTGKEQEIASVGILDLFAGKGHANLVASDALDVSYEKTVRNSDAKGKIYILRNGVRFTDKEDGETYIYGSTDSSFISTPNEREEVSTGAFIDENGFHLRSSEDENEDTEEIPYTKDELRLIILETLMSETLYEEDIGSLKITEDDEKYYYEYTLSGERVTEYGEYLLSAFIEEENYGSVSLSGYSYSVIKNKGKMTVRKTDLCVISETFEFDCIFAGSLEVSTELKITVNGIGEDVRVLTVSDYESGGEE